MSALVLANFPIAALIFAAVAGLPLWLVFKRPDRAPRYSPVAPAPAAASGVTQARQHAAARAAVPGRRHAAAARVARTHDTRQDETQRRREHVPA
jgi:hypothetical protein